MNGSKIFSADGEDDASESGAVNGNFNNRTSVRIVQVLFISLYSKIMFYRTCCVSKLHNQETSKMATSSSKVL